MKQTKTQLEKDLSFCIDECGMDDKSVGEMLRDINDPKYSTDSAFRADVEAKVKASNVL